MYAFIILFLVDAYLFMQTPTFAPARKVVEVPPVVASGEKGKYVVYGTMKCGWTRKQLDEMKSKGVDYTFIDCDKEPEKCAGMSAYPVVQFPSGEKKIGFQNI
ncbi:hypothetical protein [Dishui Lake phycodnavirus 4]|nr:hypothetical protein [Dishui Lake phycodnavirus 4]